jgi:hypothetical protein
LAWVARFELGVELMLVLMGGEKTRGLMSEGVVVVERESGKALAPANSAIGLGRSLFLVGGCVTIRNATGTTYAFRYKYLYYCLRA